MLYSNADGKISRLHLHAVFRTAVMVQLNPSDYGEGLFDGMNFQKRLERKAFEYGGGGYKAPVQLFGDFLKGVNSCGFGEVSVCTVKDCNYSCLLC